MEHVSDILSSAKMQLDAHSVTVAAVVVLLTVGIARLLQRPRGKMPPGNLGLPFFGELIQLMSDQLQFYLERSKKFGAPFLTHLFFHPTVVVSSDEDMRWLWETERKGLTKISWPSHFVDMLGHGAVTSATGDRHRALRRLLGPAFAPTSIRDYVDIIDETTQRQLRAWADTGSFLPSSVFKAFALRLLLDCAFEDVDDEMLSQFSADFRIWLDGMTALIPYPLPGTAMAKSLAARKKLIVLIQKLVEDFKQSHPSDSEKAKKTLLGRLGYRVDSEGNVLSDEDLCDNILIILFAGHDTTYVSLGTLLHNLFQCADGTVQEALKEEVNKEALSGATLNFDALKNAPVLNAVMAESWRRDPPVANGGGKVALEDIRYKQWNFPKGIILQYNIMLSAYNQERYPNPSEFNVSRFLPKDHSLVKDLGVHAKGVDYNSMNPAFAVFGGGNHGCLGSQFARLEARIVLTRMLQFYDVEVRNSKKMGFPFNGYTTEFRLTPKCNTSLTTSK